MSNADRKCQESRMSERLNLKEEVSTLHFFSDLDFGLNTSNVLSPVEESVLSEPEPSDSLAEWKGVSLDEIYKGREPFDFQELPHIHSSATHNVLFALPLSDRGAPQPYPFQSLDKWCPGFVRMPHSVRSLYPTQKEGRNKELRSRWEVIQEALLQSFTSSFQLEAAIFSYNQKYASRWNFSALHHFFSEAVDEDEAGIFFNNLLPKIIQLALQLPSLITGPIPLLTRYTNASISLSQLQVASLLANAFLCTFPRRNSTNLQSEYANYPYINFNRLFSAFKEKRQNRRCSINEKLKCIFHYFRRVTTKAPEGTITIQRRYVSKENCPKWAQLSQKLPLLHITSKGTIESEGHGLLQVDFANKFIGGGVLGWGCVQEEIRFVICPELLVTMLVTEVLDETEAVVVSGVERFSKYEGYSDSFKWAGDFIDETPRDNSGRRKTSIVAIDALAFRQTSTQFRMSNVVRELNKAYVGFNCNASHRDNLPGVATGNWGCGAFRGSSQLKVLLQLMATAIAGRSLVYFTFGDVLLRDSIFEMYCHLVQRNVDIGHLFSLISQYEESMPKSHRDFYPFLYNPNKMKPITSYFKKSQSSSEVCFQSKSFFSKSSKSLDKWKCESGSTITVQGDSVSDEMIPEWLTNFDKVGEKETITNKSDQCENGKIENISAESSRDERVVFGRHMCEKNCKSNSNPQNQFATSSKKKPSLWDSPMYKDSYK